MKKPKFSKGIDSNKIYRKDYELIISRLKCDSHSVNIPSDFFDEIICIDLVKTSNPERLLSAVYGNFQPYDNFKIDRDIIEYYYSKGKIDAKTRVFLYDFFRKEFSSRSAGLSPRSGYYLSADGASIHEKKKPFWEIGSSTTGYVFSMQKNDKGEMCCPICRLANIQKREMVIDGGISKTVGFGVSSSGSALVGLSQSRTNVSRNADFNRGDLDGAGVFVILVCAGAAAMIGWIPGAIIDAIFSTQVSIYSASIFAIVVTIYGMLTIGMEASREGAEDRKREWMCLSCGHKF